MNSWDAFWIGAVAGSLALAIIGRQWRDERRGAALSAGNEADDCAVLIQRAVYLGRRRLITNSRPVGNGGSAHA